MDPIQFVKVIQKRVGKLSKRIGDSNNARLKEMAKRLDAIDDKLSRQFGIPYKEDKHDK